MPTIPTMPVPLAPVVPTLLPDTNKAARAAELQARIQSKLATVGLGAAGAQSGYW